MATRYYEKDGNVGLLKGKTIAIIGYGSQGHAHALNLRDSGLDVMVGLPESSQSRVKATAAGLRVLSTADAAKAADTMMILVPDHVQGDLYKSAIEPHLAPGKTIMFAHGFAIRFEQIKPPSTVDVTMIAPKAPATACASCSRKAWVFRRWLRCIRMLRAKPSKTRSRMPWRWVA